MGVQNQELLDPQAELPLSIPLGLINSLDCEALTCPYLVPQFLQLSWEGPVFPQGSKHQPMCGSP